MKASRLFRRVVSAAAALAAVLFLLALALNAGSQEDNLTTKDPKVKQVMDVQEAFTPDLMSIEDVLGTAVSEDADGEIALMVFVNLEGKNPAKAVKAIPATIGTTRVNVEVTEPFRAMVGKGGGKKPGTSVSHTAIQEAPIQLGTSGGWGYDRANGYCCGGTLGALIQKGAQQYVLSNYHVYESDIISGGNNRVATDGDGIIQPGLIDVGCNLGNAQTVATLLVNSSLPDSNVDAAIAEVVPGMVRSDGAILEIGTISSVTADASINQAVKKSGRTTGLTASRVVGLNATVSVTYENECAGGIAFTKTFTGQILISNKGSRFLNSGDSGSLMVEDKPNNPRAVGLLFAGSSTIAVANPIGEVLDFFGNYSMVGK